MSKFILKIYVAGFGKRNADTIATCKAFCSQSLAPKSYEIKVIDILKDTAAAEKNKILATPTLVYESDTTEKRVIGELKDLETAKKAIEFLTAR